MFLFRAHNPLCSTPLWWSSSKAKVGDDTGDEGQPSDTVCDTDLTCGSISVSLYCASRKGINLGRTCHGELKP